MERPIFAVFRKNQQDPVPRCRQCRKLLKGVNDEKRGVTRYGYQGDGVFCTARCGVEFARKALAHDAKVELYQVYPIRHAIGTAPCGVCGQYPSREGARARCRDCKRYGHACCMRGVKGDICMDCQSEQESRGE